MISIMIMMIDIRIRAAPGARARTPHAQ